MPARTGCWPESPWLHSVWCSSASQFYSEAEMTWGPVTLMALVFIVQEALGGIDANLSGALEKQEESQWEYTLSTYTSLVLNGRHYANPTLLANAHSLHSDPRYRYVPTN